MVCWPWGCLVQRRASTEVQQGKGSTGSAPQQQQFERASGTTREEPASAAQAACGYSSEGPAASGSHTPQGSTGMAASHGQHPSTHEAGQQGTAVLDGLCHPAVLSPVQTVPAAIGHADLLSLVFERSPPGEQCFTVGRLSKEWRAWAASRAAALRRRLAQLPSDAPTAFTFDRAAALFPVPHWFAQESVPLWFVQESWPEIRGSRERLGSAIKRAARRGDLAALEWVLASGPEHWLWVQRRTDVCAAAASSGQLAALQWAWRHNFAWDTETCWQAAGGGHLEVLQWARRHGCPSGTRTCSAAAGGGHLEVLQWARRHGCPWDEETCHKAARSGHLGVLQWARQHGCRWDEKTCRSAAGSGHLEVLQWARLHGCPWDAWTCSRAAGGGHLEVLRWAWQRGCPWDEWTCIWAARSGQLEVLQWAGQHGCPWSKNGLEKHAMPRAERADDAVQEWVAILSGQEV